MNIFARLFKILWVGLWYSFAIVTVFIAASFGLLRLVLPMASQYSADIEKHASAYVGQSVKVLSLDAEWHGFGPSLVLKDVRLLNKKGDKTIIQFSKVLLDLDVFSSIAQQQISFSGLDLHGANLSFVRYKDGRISIADFDLENKIEDEVSDKEFLSNWLLSQGNLSIEVSNLLFEDRLKGGKYFHFSNVSASLRNKGDQHLVDAELSLPEDDRHKFHMSFDINGNPLAGLGWSSKFYMTGHRVDFRKMLGIQAMAKRFFTFGESDFKIWGELNKGALKSLEGEFSAKDVLSSSSLQLIKSDTKSLLSVYDPKHIKSKTDDNSADVISFEYVAARFKFESNESGWDLSGDQLVISRNGRLWPATQFDVNYSENKQKQKRLEMHTSFARLQDLFSTHPFALMENDEVSALLTTLNPRGDLRNFKLVWDESDLVNTMLQGSFEKLSVNKYEEIPGISELSGIINLHQQYGSVRLDSYGVMLDAPSLFRDEHLLTKLEGDIHWFLEDDSWIIQTGGLVLNTNDINTQLYLDLDLPNSDQSPYLTLMADFNNGKGSQVPKYIPAKILSEGLVEWLDGAIIDGAVPSGSVMFQGHTRDFPFDKQEGVFEVRFDVENGVLNYMPGWPGIDEINAEVVFRDNSLTVSSNQAKIFQSQLSNVQVSIPELDAKPIELKITGDVYGRTTEKLWYLRKSPPLNEAYGQYLQDIQMAGLSNLKLELDLKLANNVTADMNGELTFENNSIKVNGLGMVLNEMNGKLRIKPEGLYSDNIQANLFGQPSAVKVNTTDSGMQQNHINITAKGMFDVEHLSDLYLPTLKERVSGKSEWDVLVAIPIHTKEKDQGSGQAGKVNVIVESDLDGVELQFPSPFNKTKNNIVKSKIDIRLLGDEQFVIQAALGGMLDGAVYLNAAEKKDNIKGQIRFGGGPVAIPKNPGLQFYGRIENLNLDVWQRLVADIQSDLVSESDESEKQGRKESNLNNCCWWLQSASLSIDEFVFYGQELSSINIISQNTGNTIASKVNSNKLSGEIIIPHDMQNFPVELNLDYWHLSSASISEDESVEVDPRELPAIKAFSKLITFKNRRFGKVRVETTKLANGLRLEQLVVEPSATIVTAHGQWLFEAGKHKSNFDFQLSSEDLGKTLDDLNYQGSIYEGEGTINVSVEWPGSLTRVDPEHLNGSVKLDFKNGKLLEVDPGGAGRRIFGLFSIATLPRRLILDFSDLFGKGFEFSEIKGDFKITEGDAYTDNFYLESPGVNAKLSGRIGLAKQDYDQRVIVTPHVSDLTALLTLLSSEPLLFLIQQLLKDKINNVASFEYKLSGPWDNYVLEPINKPVIEEPEEDF